MITKIGKIDGYRIQQSSWVDAMRLCAKRVMGGLIVAASVMLVGAPAVYAAEAGDADNDLTETRATFNKDEATEAKAFVAAQKTALKAKVATKPTKSALATFKAAQKTALTTFRAAEKAEVAAWRAAHK